MRIGEEGADYATRHLPPSPLCGQLVGDDSHAPGVIVLHTLHACQLPNPLCVCPYCRRKAQKENAANVAELEQRLSHEDFQGRNGARLSAPSPPEDGEDDTEEVGLSGE